MGCCSTPGPSIWGVGDPETPWMGISEPVQIHAATNDSFYLLTPPRKKKYLELGIIIITVK